MPLTDNLEAYYKMEESSGNDRVDSAGSNNLSDGQTVASGTGIIDNGADFELGNSEYLNRADTASLSLSGNCSFSFWFNPETLATRQEIITKYLTTGNQRSYLISLLADDKMQIALYSDGTGGTNEILINATDAAVFTGTGTFVFVVLTFNIGTEAVIWYRNGSSVASTTSVSPLGAALHDGTADFALGAIPSPASGFLDGVLDEVGVWSRILTSSEVTTLYNGGAGLTHPFTPVRKTVNTIAEASMKTMNTIANANIASSNTAT